MKDKRIVSLQRPVIRAVGKFVTLYRKEPLDTENFIRNGNRINAAMANLIREWGEYERARKTNK